MWRLCSEVIFWETYLSAEMVWGEQMKPDSTMISWYVIIDNSTLFTLVLSWPGIGFLSWNTEEKKTNSEECMALSRMKPRSILGMHSMLNSLFCKCLLAIYIITLPYFPFELKEGLGIIFLIINSLHKTEWIKTVPTLDWKCASWNSKIILIKS